MKNRIYNDYFMKSRISEYEKLLSDYLENGYIFLMIKESRKKLDDKKKYIFIRHDIDSDIKIARKMFEVEKKLNIKTTYYFRLSTFDKKLVEDIINYGSEVGYHYEEIATYCKENNIFDKDNIIKNTKIIKEKFINNVKTLQNKYNLKFYSIASHGDFINRKIKLTNDQIYDKDLKNKLKFIEAYDMEYMLDFRTSDCMPPKFFKQDPYLAIKNNKKKVLLLIHTRYWGSAPIERFKLDLNRIIDSIRYR